MDHEFHSIVEKLAILEGRIAPKDNTIAETTSKQKKPALFNNLKKQEESAIPMVGGVEFAEEKSDDVLSKVKASLADYLKSAEEDIKQDKDLIAKKKQDLDLKKKELKDLDLQQTSKKEEVEEAIPETLEEDKLSVGDPIIVTAPNEYEGMTGEITEFSPSGKFVVVNLYNGGECSMHLSDVEFNQYADDEDNDYDDEDEFDPSEQQGFKDEVEEGDTYAQGGISTYASESAPVKTMEVELQEMGGSVLVEIHGDERNGFSIKRAGKELSTKFKSLAEAELALEMFTARRQAVHDAEQSADYIEEK